MKEARQAQPRERGGGGVRTERKAPSRSINGRETQQRLVLLIAAPAVPWFSSGRERSGLGSYCPFELSSRGMLRLGYVARFLGLVFFY